MIAVEGSPLPVILALVIGLAAMALMLVIAADDHERPVPRPPRVDDLPPVAARLRDESVAWDETSRADRKARLIAELEAEHEVLRGRRERDAEALIDRIFPDPTIPKGER